MRWNSAVVGAKVKHVVMKHWGEGKIVARRQKDNLGLRTANRIQVMWFDMIDDQGGSHAVYWLRLSELRSVK